MSVEIVIAAIAEITKLLIMAQSTAIKAGLTPEQFEAIVEAVNKEFEARDPSALPER